MGLVALIVIVLGIVLFVYAGYLTTTSTVLPHSPAASLILKPGSGTYFPATFNFTYTIVSLISNSSSPFSVSVENVSSLVREEFVQNAYLLVLGRNAVGLKVEDNLSYPIELNYTYTPLTSAVEGQFTAIAASAFLSIAALIVGGIVGLVALALYLRKR